MPHLLTALVVVVAGLPLLIMPLHVDQATFAMVGREIARGGFPYVDIWDQKPPAIYFIYAVAVQGPFDIMRNVRLFEIGWTAATAVTLLELGRRWWNVRAGVLAGLVYGLAHLNNDPWWMSGQPDSLMVLPLALALVWYGDGRSRRGRLIAAGALLGVACQLRFQMVLYIPFFPFVELVETRTGRVRLWFTRMVWLGIGFAALQAAVLLYLIAGGAFAEFVRTMRYAAGYTGLGGPWNPAEGPTWQAYLTALRDSFAWWGYFRMVLVLPALAGAFYGAFLLRNARVAQLGILLLLSYLAVAVQAKFFWYHFGHLFLALSLLFGWTSDRTLSALRRRWAPVPAYAIAAITLLVLLLNSGQLQRDAWNEWRSLIRFYTHPEERDAYYALVGNGYAGIREVSAHVRGRTSPGDRIFVWGFDPAIYLLAERSPGARFMFTFPFMSDWSPPEWRQSLVTELERNRPVYFLVEHGSTATWITGTSVDMAESIASFPELQRWLSANYRYEADIGGITFYRRVE